MMQGYKTYIMAILIGIVAVVYQLNLIDLSTRDTLITLLGAGTAASLGAKVNRLNNRVR